MTGSSCDPTVQSARNNIDGQSLSFTFVGTFSHLDLSFLYCNNNSSIGTSVYMAAASTDKSGGYAVSVDNQAMTSVDAFAGASAAPSCGYAVHYPPYAIKISP